MIMRTASRSSRPDTKHARGHRQLALTAWMFLAIAFSSQRSCTSLAADTIGLYAPAAERDAPSGAVCHGWLSSLVNVKLLSAACFDTMSLMSASLAGAQVSSTSASIAPLHICTDGAVPVMLVTKLRSLASLARCMAIRLLSVQRSHCALTEAAHSSWASTILALRCVSALDCAAAITCVSHSIKSRLMQNGRECSDIDNTLGTDRATCPHT